MKKLGILGSFACAVLLAACGGSEEAKTGDDQNLTEGQEEVFADVEAYVTGDLVFGNKADALASWQKACEAWKTSAAEVGGQRLLDASCGEPEQLADWLFGSTTTASYRAVVPRGMEPVRATEHTVLGKYDANLDVKARSWADGCAAEVERARAIHGDRLLSASCLKPTRDAKCTTTHRPSRR